MATSNQWQCIGSVLAIEQVQPVPEHGRCCSMVLSRIVTCCDRTCAAAVTAGCVDTSASRCRNYAIEVSTRWQGFALHGRGAVRCLRRHDGIMTVPHPSGLAKCADGALRWLMMTHLTRSSSDNVRGAARTQVHQCNTLTSEWLWHGVCLQLERRCCLRAESVCFRLHSKPAWRAASMHRDNDIAA